MPVSAVDALRQIAAALNESATEKVPPGWRTVKQFAGESGVSEVHASHILRSGVSAGVAERKDFRVAMRGGVGVRKTPHYRLLEAKK